MGHILLPNNRIGPELQNETLALQHVKVLCYKGWKVRIYKGLLYGNATVLLEKAILLIIL